MNPYHDTHTGRFISRAAWDRQRAAYMPVPRQMGQVQAPNAFGMFNGGIGGMGTMNMPNVPAIPNPPMGFAQHALNKSQEIFDPNKVNIPKHFMQTVGGAGGVAAGMARLLTPSPSAIGTSTAIGSGLDYGSAKMHIRYYGYAPVDAENMGRPMMKYLKGGAVEYGVPETAQHLIASGGTLDEQRALQKMVEAGYYYE